MDTSIFAGTMMEMNWVDLETAIRDGAVVLWPTAAIEEHGPHMSLAADVFIAYLLSKRVQEQLQTMDIRALVAPPYYWGINAVTASFPGSFTVRRETLEAVYHDILASLFRWGVNDVFVVDIHGDRAHRIAIIEALQDARTEIGVRAYYIVPYVTAKRYGFSGQEPYLLIEDEETEPLAFTTGADVHAGAMETSFMQRYYPSHVDAELARTLAPTELSQAEWKRWAQGWSDAQRVTPLGYNGDPASIHVDLAEVWLEREVGRITSLIARAVRGEYQPPSPSLVAG